MPRLSDMIRRGQSVFEREKEKAAEEPEQEAAPQQSAQSETTEETGAEFRSLPGPQQPPPAQMQDFPILSQIHNEVGTVATVVEQISRISDFIQAFATGEEVPVQRPPAQAPPAAAPAGPPAEAPPAAPGAPPPSPAAPPQPPAEAPPEPEAASEEEAEALYDQLYAFVEGVMTAAQAGNPFTIDQSFILIARALDLPQATDVLYRQAIYTRETDDDHGFGSAVVLHSVNVAVYTLKVGEGLGYNRDRLIDLGVAALLHDVGMVTLPPDIFSKGQLTQQDIEVLHQHPIKGHDILARLEGNYQWLADVARQEHEREDGTGYPQALKANDIHEYAKIVGVADTYAGLTRSRPERRGLLPFEAVKEILQNHKPKFDTRVVRVLLRKLSAFPIGSLVKLNSGAIGTVIETDEANQLRPVIRIFYDAQGRRVDEDRIIHLREYPILHITDVIYEEDLEQ